MGFSFSKFRTVTEIDLTCEQSINLLELKDIKALAKSLPIADSVIDIDKILPIEAIHLKDIPNKGWGIIASRNFKKGDIIYVCPINQFSLTNRIKVISSIGTKDINPHIHMGPIEKYYNIFSYYDCFLNHSFFANAYHATELFVRNKNLNLVLFAQTTILRGEEILINYFYDVNPLVILLKSVFGIDTLFS